MQKQRFSYYMPTKIHFGEDESEKVGHLTRQLGKKVLIVTGKMSMKRLGITGKIIRCLRDSSIETMLYDNIPPNPTVEIVDEGADLAAKKNCDVIIGLGGGSALDSAKGIAVAASHGGSIWDYVEGRDVTEKTFPVVVIPTTAGTGSETTPYSVFTNKKTLRKDAISSAYTFPKVAIIDPTLMKSMPPDLTADTGFDALAHAVEAYLSTSANPLSNSIAMGTISLVNKSLVAAVRNGEDLEARTNMALASSMAGMAIAQAGVVAGHGFGMSIGGILDTPHGRTVGILLPHVMSYSLSKASDRIAQLAGCFNLPTTEDKESDARKVIEAVVTIMKKVSFPARLGETGVEKADIKRIVSDCMNRPDMENNPRKFDSEEAQEFLQLIL